MVFCALSLLLIGCLLVRHTTPSSPTPAECNAELRRRIADDTVSTTNLTNLDTLGHALYVETWERRMEGL